MPSYPVWIDESTGVFLREVAEGLFVGAKGAASVRTWGLVVDLHGTDGITARTVISYPFSDGAPFPPAALDHIHSAVHQALSQQEEVLLCCEVGRSRSASAAYAILRTCFGVRPGDARKRIVTNMTIPTGRRKLSMLYPRRQTLESASTWAENRIEQLKA